MKRIFVKQHDATDCAAACLAMICLYYKKDTTITKLRDMMGTDLKGTNLIGLSKCADILGFESKAVRVDKKGFLSSFTLPCIANMITKEGLTHFVVVYKKTENYVVIGDPAKEFLRITLNEFMRGFAGVLLILKPNNSFSREKNKDKVLYLRFIKLLLPHKKLFVFSIIASLILTVLGIVSSLFNKILMDEILPYKLRNTLLLVVLVFVIVSVVQLAVSFIRQWMLIFLSQKIDIPLLLGYFEHIYRLPIKFFATRKTGDIMTRFSDAFTIKDVFTNIALTVIMDISMAIITGVILFRMNGGLFAIIAVLTIISILLVFIFKQPYKELNQEQMQQNSILNSQIIEGLRAVETIKGNANEDTEIENIEREYVKTLRLSYREGMLSNIQSSIAGFVQTCGGIIMMFFGITQVIDGTLTLGSLMSFSTLAGFFTDPVSRLVGLQLQLQEAGISMKRMTEILDYQREQEGKNLSEIMDFSGNIEFDNVTFRYGNRKAALKNVSFSIKNGEKVAVIGSSGSGKSTLAKLILKYYEPEEGEIIVNGENIKEFSNESVRRAVSYVPQNIELFSKSIYDNIRVTKLNSLEADVIEAAKKADAHDFIRKLPLQYNTYLEEAGAGLSGGEKQRIAIARAFLKNSAFYIFDESTSNLDFGTENIIFNAIFNKMKNKTMLIIAHRLSTIRNCDKIIVLEKGEIIEQGNHSELMGLQGKYFELWNMQQGFIKPINTEKVEEKETDIYIEEVTYS
ncbi:MAG: peptidase domain-containing ABC transporter [Lachnospiraceae bacterium]|jgi:ATP-binding cassette subfamily B protein|nr:peptidase domain-containing ABC transporter [Lachnospiraceae bacterium]